MEEHPIQGLMTTAMENLKDMIEVNTIIGDPVESPDGSVIIPVSKLGFGFAAGGSEFTGSSGSGGDSGQSLPFGGGSGGGVSITPIAFLILGKNGIKMVHLDQQTHLYEKMLNNAPQVVEKIQQILRENNNGREEGEKKEEEKKPSAKDDKREKPAPSSYDI
ncbi:sporulation protein YtfJ [Oceanobacillus piezotolerans]|uniref:Sporulation protein YtfJ n=1 Tax=Oceanobacillus piezotolerans TaxID=2448030 RepID=A0A498DLD4_9BACI|nr:GerW family sporulation protein [Oceanobacillus piezotolerans]RLL47850.1 sporulation protein YtfJ [Oceanobacillus piezotolerans]